MHQLYFAPMEGITTAAFRCNYRRHFAGMDKYFTPFLAADQTKHFKRKEIRDILPENNQDIRLVPQILTNQPDQFAWAVKTLEEYGYHEVNLNLGCSMPQVANRGRGAGFLSDPDRLDAFFESFFEEIRQSGNTGQGASDPSGITGTQISVKTRIGVKDPGEAAVLLKIFNRYPFSEVIVHPRLLADHYDNHPDLEVFGMFYEECIHPVCYNGDLVTAPDVEDILSRFPKLDRIMIGRGLIRNPSLSRQIRGGCAADKEELSGYLASLWDAYGQTVLDERQVVGKIKEIWWYLQYLFPGSEKQMKRIRKARTAQQYQEAAEGMLNIPMRVV